MTRYFILITILVSFSMHASADTFRWAANTSAVGYSSPSAFCKATADGKGSSSFKYASTIIMLSSTKVDCRLDYLDGTPGYNVSTGYLYGTSCDGDAIYVPDQYECISPEEPPPDECEAKNGESTTFTKSGTAPDPYSSVSGGYVHPNQSACFGGCVVSTSDQKCTGLTTGRYTCVGKAYYTGQQCTAQPEVDFTDSPEPEPKTITDEKPCQYIEQSDGTLRCDSAKSTEKEGQYCGEVNGVKKCVDAKPTKNGVDISTEVKTETNPDGSTTTTKTDTATHTTCSGVNSCTSTTTTTTTTTNKNAGGGTTSVTGSCTGPACPDKNTNPDGDGDGFGDCVGGNCSESGDGSGSPDLEDVAGFGESTGDFMNRVSSSPIMTAIDGIGLNGSGSCSMSSASTIIGTIDASSFCDNASWLNPLYYVFLAIHALVAVRVFLSA